MKVLIEIELIENEEFEFFEEEVDREWLQENIEKIPEFKDHYRIIAIEYGRWLYTEGHDAP